MAYALSKDYEKLFELLMAGEELAAYVDKQFSGSDYVHRDICQVWKDDANWIHFSARGIGYGHIMPENKGDEPKKEHFIALCEMSNLGWIKP